MAKRIMILSVIRSDFSKSVELGKKLRDAGHSVFFYFDQTSHDLSGSVQEARELKFPYFASPGKNGKGAAAGTGKKKVSNPNSFLRFVKRVIKTLASGIKTTREFKKTIQAHAISSVVTPVNSCGYNMPLYLNVCARLGITTYCLPFAIGEKRALARSVSAIHGRNSGDGINKLISKLFPRWLLPYGDNMYLILPAEKILCNFLLRFKVHFPESFYGVKVDNLLLENEEMLQHALQEGSAAKRNIVTGSFFDDVCYHLLKDKADHYRQFCEQYGLDASKKMICVALPPLEKLGDDYRNNFITALHRFVPGTIGKEKVNIVVSLHPRIPADLINDLPVFPGIVTLLPAEKLIPLCDLFVACYSSTIRTALRCGVPVINYDIFSFHYDLFSDTPGVTKVTEQIEYDKVMLQSIDSFSSRNASGTMTFDGKAAERIINEITKHG